MQQENYISMRASRTRPACRRSTGQAGDVQGEVRFEVTDKSLDFLGLQNACAICWARSASRVSAATTRAHWATGIEASGASQRYEFGDTLNLDTTTTL